VSTGEGTAALGYAPHGWPETTDAALEVARDLARAGVPIFLAPADGAGGFRHPRDWQATEADPAELDRWRPGMAVCAVMGVVCDGVDVDPRHGGDASETELRTLGAWPRSFGRTRTPSGGTHDLIARTRAGSRDNLRPGLDVKGGRDDGTGRGFIFIAPTYRVSKINGEPLPPYEWEAGPNLDGIEEDEGSDEVTDLARLIREALADATLDPEPTEQDTTEHDALTEAQRARVDKWITAAVDGVRTDLRAAADWRTGQRDEHGRGWEKLTADAANRLGRLARAPWNRLTLTEARAALLDAAPTDSTWTAKDVAKKWSEQCHRRTPAAWPSALDAREGDAELSGVPAAYHGPGALSEARLADRVAREVLAGRYCWTGALGWLHWDGRRWHETPEVTVVDAVRLYFIDQHAQAARRGADSEELQAFSRLLGRNRIMNVVALTRGVACVLADAATFDQHPDLLNVGNGVVDLRTGRLGPHDPALYLTKITTVEYDPDATSPDWDAALESLPEDVRPWWQVRVGQAATGHTPPDDVLPVGQGGGSNGKTAQTGAIQRALGEHAVLVSDRVLLANPDAHPTELMDLRGARLALIEETPEARRLSVSRLKKAIGTPMITARHIRRDDVSFVTSHSLFLTTNYRPQIEEVDHGTWRRLALVRFPYRYVPPGGALYSDHDRRGDPGLRQRLLTGAANQRAVLRWIVDGARTWYAADCVMPALPDRVVADTRAWRVQADHVLGYVTDRLVIDPDRHVMSSDLLVDFNAWAVERGLRAWGDQTLSERFGGHAEISGAGVEKRKLVNGPGVSRPPGSFLAAPAPPRSMGWVGVRFRTAADDAEDALARPVAGVAGVSGFPPSSPSHRALPSTPATPATATLEEPDEARSEAAQTAIPPAPGAGQEPVGAGGAGAPSDAAVAGEPGPLCTLCGQTLLLVSPGRDVCGRCHPAPIRSAS